MTGAGAGAAVLWTLACLRWFDAGAAFRPAWLEALPPAALALPAVVLATLWLRGCWSVLWGTLPPGARGALLLLVGLAFLVRLPLAWWGAAGYTTADGALSGIVALHVRDGVDHHVFVPQVPYSGSLKSHVAAPLAGVMDPARAFALVSVAFYAAFVAALYRLALLAQGGERTAMAAGLYAVFAPAFVTHYSLSNDGNYVEVLAFGTWALVLAIRWIEEPHPRRVLSLATGLLLGLGFWCHILAVIHAAAVALALLAADRRAAVRTAPALLGGAALAYAPGFLWNAGHGWESFRSFLPPSQPAAASVHGPGILERAAAMVGDHWPVLLGYDPGYPPAVDAAVRALAIVAVVCACWALGRAARAWWSSRLAAEGVLLLFTAVNLGVALALRYVPGNPRYLLFLMAPVPVFLAQAFGLDARRWLLALLVAFGLLGSLAQSATEVDSDARWRGFVSDLEREGVRYCYTDFYLATKINFLSQERIVCSAKLGPTRTEYFFEYRERVDAAPEAALVAVNATNAEKLERRLERLGVSWQRRDLMKPVLLRLSRKVDPEELFPGQSFGLR